jgi:hypothetical protein
MELCWVKSLLVGDPRLQQKWMEHYPTCVFTDRGGNVRPLPGTPTGNFEWRDVPTVTEGT